MPKTYGKSLYMLASEENITDKILSEMRVISKLFGENPDYVKILDSPQLNRKELMEILNEDLLGQVGSYTLNFLKILCEKHMVHCFGESLKEYVRLYNRDNNIEIVQVTTARPMKNDIIKKLTAVLEAKTGKRITLNQKVDSGCIGGIIIEAEGIRLDSSVKTELNKIKAALLE